MLKHLPEGLVPFEDCGFARYPARPLEKEAMVIACRTDEEDGQPELLLYVNDKAVKPLAPESNDGEYWRFHIGEFNWGDKIEYQLRTKKESSRIFRFEIEKEIKLHSPINLIKLDEAIYCLLYEYFHIIIKAGEVLEVSCIQDSPPSGEKVSCAEIGLPEGYRLYLSDGKKCFSLKRLSEGGTLQEILTLDCFMLRITSDGSIRQLKQCGKLDTHHVWGTGERFHSVDLRQSYSSGRVVEKFTQQEDHAYLPIPFFFTEKNIGCFRNSNISAAMDFREGLIIDQRTKGHQLTHDVWLFGSPKNILSQFITYTGKPVLPPDWAFGVWISGNGWNCDAEVYAQLEMLKRFNYPADVMVLEAWSDEQTFYLWNDKHHWKDPAALVRFIKNEGLHLVLWQIPIIKYEWNETPCEQLISDEKEAIENGYCILNEDGTPYRITEKWFHNSLLLDFTNPKAVQWWFDKRKYLLDMGVEGFKTDGGEFLFDETAKLHNGLDGLEAHNLYPGQYIGAYNKFLKENGINGVTFSRADYIGAQTRPIHWAGDQLSKWSELKAQLNAGISAGLSGILFWGFDIGGFAGELPGAELYLRATAFACFCPIMQWHAEPRSGQFYSTNEDGFNNDRSPWNIAEKLNDIRVLEVSVKFARLRKQIQPYLTSEAEYCVNVGRPLMAHLCIDYPEDINACNCDDQYMLGRELMVCPIVEEGQDKRRVWIPKGTWKHYFTGEVYKGGTYKTFTCLLDEAIVLQLL